MNPDTLQPQNKYGATTELTNHILWTLAQCLTTAIEDRPNMLPSLPKVTLDLRPWFSFTSELWSWHAQKQAQKSGSSKAGVGKQTDRETRPNLLLSLLKWSINITSIPTNHGIVLWQLLQDSDGQLVLDSPKIWTRHCCQCSSHYLSLFLPLTQLTFRVSSIIIKHTVIAQVMQHQQCHEY